MTAVETLSLAKTPPTDPERELVMDQAGEVGVPRVDTTVALIGLAGGSEV